MIHAIIIVPIDCLAPASCIVHPPVIHGLIAAGAIGAVLAKIAVVETHLAGHRDVLIVQSFRAEVVASLIGHEEVGRRFIAPMFLQNQVYEFEVEEGVQGGGRDRDGGSNGEVP